MSLMYHDTVIAGTPVIDNTPTAGSNHAVSSGGVKSALDNKADNSALGIEEAGNTATHAITAGQYVMWKGAPYTADVNIAIGTTLASTGGSKNLSTATNGGLNDLKSNFEKHALGTAVSILSYTSGNNMYTVPHDGYVIMSSGPGQGNYCLLYTDGNVVLGLARTPVAAYNTYIPVFVRKGMHLRVDQGSTGGANYYPLN